MPRAKGKKKKKTKVKRKKKGSEAINEEAPAAEEVEQFIIFLRFFLPFTLFVFGRRRWLSPPAPAVQGLIALSLEPRMVPLKMKV